MPTSSFCKLTNTMSYLVQMKTRRFYWCLVTVILRHWPTCLDSSGRFRWQDRLRSYLFSSPPIDNTYTFKSQLLLHGAHSQEINISNTSTVVRSSSVNATSSCTQVCIEIDRSEGDWKVTFYIPIRNGKLDPGGFQFLQKKICQQTAKESVNKLNHFF